MSRAAACLLAVVLLSCSTQRPEPTTSVPTTGPSASAESPSAPAPSPAAVWDEPPAYEFVLDSDCGWQNLPGPFRVNVLNGSVVEVDPLGDYDEGGRTFPTLAGILAIAEAAREDEADAVELILDPSDAHPLSLEIDRDSTAIDDEQCFEISEYGVLSRGSGEA